VLVAVNFKQMGIHIIPYIVGKRIELDYGDKIIEAEEYKNFDCLRQGGDSDFVFQEDFEWERLYEDPDKPDYEHHYRRPKDIDTAINWIKQNIPNGGERLIQLMEDMRKDLNLWIVVSY
jgi:hypothetical protein